MSWLERIFRRRYLYDEVGEEVREHIEEKTEQLMRLENLSRVDARRAALRAFGNPTLVQTRSVEVWQWSRLESLLADLKLALRRLRKSPGFAAVAIVTLALVLTCCVPVGKEHVYSRLSRTFRDSSVPEA